MECPRVLLVDDHVLFTDGLAKILRPHCEIVGTAHDGEAAVTAAERLRPDIIILDISLPRLNGIEVARRIQRLGTPSRIVFCTMYSEPTLVTEAIRAGAAGYVLKTAAGTEMIRALEEVVQGRSYFSSGIGPEGVAGAEITLPS
jgi:DNA-binding NarL/FixJ family response regulator